MEIIKKKTESELNVALVGRLDTTTAPQFEAELKQNIDGITRLVLDFEKLEYMSSAGLRVLLAAQKVMNKQGETVITSLIGVINPAFSRIFLDRLLTNENPEWFTPFLITPAGMAEDIRRHADGDAHAHFRRLGRRFGWSAPAAHDSPRHRA